MEQLIILAIIAIVSSIFGKSKKKEQKPMPPFNKNSHVEPPVETTQERRPSKPQSFEDFAREFLGEWKNEQPQAEEPKKIVEETVKKDVPSYAAPPLIPTEKVSRTTNRESIGRMAAGKKVVGVAKTQSAFQLPKSKKSLMQAVVMAEVLGPPKAKRK
ncbi:hypothetical protein [Lysinibacillus xylanilyticus]|uniref:hypothetical protein n=1 Tax=Lysinibacillus xylanilyticus TaxID=582475 RepID=UPI003CFCFD32